MTEIIGSLEKGDSPRCGEMSRSDKGDGLRLGAGCERSEQTEGLKSNSLSVQIPYTPKKSLRLALTATHIPLQGRQNQTEELKMKYNHNKNLVQNAKALRKDMTKEERRLWYDYLRNKDVRFLRQKIIGSYIVDFYCAKANLVIELDGSQHYEDKGIEYDAERTKYLEQNGLTVIRIPNNEINRNFDGVCEYLDGILKSRCHTGD